ncbi:2-succinyl-5-enolpyruvyl-6-hydroxy-3-cyclohexene-1-carboxylic-acid synthase [Halobacillus shinanisalinarum]|uniref:2-succinyl-5-enolpyruvyl-6-hydroxy-3-cyclohexene-1-carboxylate synthase n=1 Tax=Halobacillus shinanisalinarum TaxID=2932258 RepID=A0ABY4H1Y8_9BACI|nr:2-succinyl-5-enolpyruvyl-6-hydroxy-3-cyclohexene-1-carboxylic-acid synthase [Halobacillus shinanisalinarum]UOQ94206.1 2-succinyl-5-enolpyruvyl-6-hydroxy-3-cyclohexene-1-carboxylic-acid synthase [Halobacillus shinanisalinarum]
MTYTETLTKYMTHFVDQLIYSGIEDVVISPGSRSTPLAMTFSEHSEVAHWVHVDERSAAFFALGLAKEKQKSVALVCTSGTAAANYYPAIVEAYYSRVPLVVLTADRPHELRDVGAPQSIEQIEMYGGYVKWFHDLALAEEGLLPYVRKQAARAVEESQSNHSGPVHVNVPLREPLVPDFSLEGLWNEGAKPIPKPFRGLPQISEQQAAFFEELFLSGKKGLLVCGPNTNSNLASNVTNLAARAGLPILADPLSQLRAGDHDKRNIIENYDALLKSDKWKVNLQPDFIIRLGAMPVSKAYLQWIQKHGASIDHYVVDTYASYREPSGVTTQFIWCDSGKFCKKIYERIDEDHLENDWLGKWQKMNTLAKSHMLTEQDEELNEGHVVVHLSNAMPDESVLFVGNSMPIRDVDSFFMSTPKRIRILANRGANGIDGVVSTALGVAASGQPTTLLLGDLSFFHDLNGLLLTKMHNLPITIVVINNDGGGIFSYLPQVDQGAHFEELFGTPIGIDFKAVVEMYGGAHKRVHTWASYKRSLEESYQEDGLSVVEVMTNRKDHVPFHKAKWQGVAEALENWNEA